MNKDVKRNEREDTEQRQVQRRSAVKKGKGSGQQGNIITRIKGRKVERQRNGGEIKTDVMIGTERWKR